jgi:hypothetical protein
MVGYMYGAGSNAADTRTQSETDLQADDRLREYRASRKGYAANAPANNAT